jgi:hypothetical protein
MSGSRGSEFGRLAVRAVVRVVRIVVRVVVRVVVRMSFAFDDLAIGRESFTVDLDKRWGEVGRPP